MHFARDLIDIDLASDLCEFLDIEISFGFVLKERVFYEKLSLYCKNVVNLVRLQNMKKKRTLLHLQLIDFSSFLKLLFIGGLCTRRLFKK